MTSLRAAKCLPALAGAGGLVAAALTWFTWDSNDEGPPPSVPAVIVERMPTYPAAAVVTAAPQRAIAHNSSASVSSNQVPSALQRAIVKAINVDAALAQRAARISLPEVVGHSSLTTPSGRSHAMAELVVAGELASERLATAQREMNSVLTAVRSANLDSAIKAQLLANLEQAYAQSLQQHQRLHAAQVQAISVSKGLVGFMEENQTGYDVQLGQVVFQSAGMAVQFNHYMTQVSQSVGRESKLQQETHVIRQQERSLLLALAGQAP